MCEDTNMHVFIICGGAFRGHRLFDDFHNLAVAHINGFSFRCHRARIIDDFDNDFFLIVFGHCNSIIFIEQLLQHFTRAGFGFRHLIFYPDIFSVHRAICKIFGFGGFNLGFCEFNLILNFKSRRIRIAATIFRQAHTVHKVFGDICTLRFGFDLFGALLSVL